MSGHVVTGTDGFKGGPWHEDIVVFCALGTGHDHQHATASSTASSNAMELRLIDTLGGNPIGHPLTLESGREP